MTIPIQVPFDTIHLGDVLTICVVALALISYLRDRRKDRDANSKTKEEGIVERARMHAENGERLKALTAFMQNQHKINANREEQIRELQTQTALMRQAAVSNEQRLRMIENLYFKLREESGSD